MNVSILLYEQNETQRSFMSQWFESSGMDCTVAGTCLLYTSPSPRDRQKSRMPSSA